MTKYQDILRLSSRGFRQRSIAASCQCSRNTVAKVLSRASEHALVWSLPEELSDAELENLLYPSKAQASLRRLRNISGVTLSQNEHTC